MRAWTVSLVVLFALGCSGADGTEGDPDPSSGDDAAAETDPADTTSEGDASTDAPADEGVEGEIGPKCPTPPIPDPLADERAACKFGKGAKVATTLGITPEQRAAIPIKHLIVVMNENRSFDHYFGKLASEGQPEAEGWPSTYSNKDRNGVAVKPYHASTTCISPDPPHGWTAMHNKWNAGKMDGFVTASDSTTSNGHYAMTYYTKTDLPFYNFLATKFAISDRYFASVIGPTWPNRDYFYAATSDGVTNTFERKINVPTIFDAMTTAKVKWGIFGDGSTRADCINLNEDDPHYKTMSGFYAALADGTLPQVSVVGPTGAQDEHPTRDIQGGEAFSRRIYEAVRKSPLWPKIALIYTYDEGGGFFDHVPPPKACIPSASEPEFNRMGFRVPLMVVSPYARPHFVSHKTHEHTSITRLIELLHDLPALTARDANSNALLDLFDFNCPAMLEPPPAPASGKGGCP